MLICPKCGATSDKAEFAGAFCLECARERIDIACPRSVEVGKCKGCGRFKVRGEWTKNPREINDLVVRKCKGDFSRAIYDSVLQRAVFFTMIHGREHRSERDIALDVQVVMCPSCSRASGGYFQSILQLRGKPEKVRKYAETIERMAGDKISKIEELKEGTDVYMMDTKYAMRLLQKLGLKSGIAKKLAGVSEGKKIYRVSFSVRLE